MHFYWSHLEARNAYPIHFSLLAAHCTSYDICILCSAQDCNCTPISEMAADLRHLLSGKAGGVKKKKEVWLYGNYVWLPQSQHGVQSYVFIAFALSEWSPLPVSVCSLPLLCSLSEDWGEPVSPRDEGLLRDAAAVSGPGEQCCTEVTGRWRGYVQNSHHSLHSCFVISPVLMIRLTWLGTVGKDMVGVFLWCS